ncbi:MAG: hypothetical protein AB7V04_13125, partial [Desulfomonilaceae bacterium]
MEIIDGRLMVLGLFSVKAYPFRNSKLFPKLSEEERALIVGDFFDGTNTPRYERFDHIHPSHFTVGTIELGYGGENSSECFQITCETLDSMKTVAVSTTIEEFVDGGSSCQTLRNLPGWELTYDLFNAIALIHLNCFDKKPSKTILKKSPGFITLVDQFGRSLSVDDKSSNLMSISISYTNDSELIPEEAKCETEILYDGNAKTCSMTIQNVPTDQDYDVLRCGPFGRWKTVNPDWWSIASKKFVCELGST